MRSTMLITPFCVPASLPLSHHSFCIIYLPHIHVIRTHSPTKSASQAKPNICYTIYIYIYMNENARPISFRLRFSTPCFCKCLWKERKKIAAFEKIGEHALSLILFWTIKMHAENLHKRTHILTQFITMAHQAHTNMFFAFVCVCASAIRLVFYSTKFRVGKWKRRKSSDRRDELRVCGCELSNSI